MKTYLYRTTGHLTGHIEPANVGIAQAYLVEHDMTQFVDDSVEAKVAHVEWHLHADGHNYHVDVKTIKPLNDDELRVMGEWISGQNSDGLGEGFEQQEFAEEQADECGDCEDCENGYECDRAYGMISFDWQTNKSELKLVEA